MAVLRLTFRSSALRGTTDVNVIYPVKPKRAGFGDPEGNATFYYPREGKFKVLWLIHGGGDNYSDWVNNTRVRNYAEDANLMVVMPSVRDFTSSRNDVDYFTYVAKELPALIRRIFPASEKREDNFIAGLSMGGYLSYRIALNFPENYGCVGSMSSPLDIVEDLKVRHANSKTLVAGDTLTGTDRDIYALVEKNLKEGKKMPKMFQCCGTEDFTYSINVKMRDFFRSKGLDHDYFESPGIHNWDFWSEYIKKLIDWLPTDGVGADGHKFQ